MASVYRRGKTYYSKLYWPSHPKAGKDGRLRVPLSTNQREAEDELARLVRERAAERKSIAPGGDEVDPEQRGWAAFTDRFIRMKKSAITRRHYLRSVRELAKIRTITSVRQLTVPLLHDVQAAWIAQGRGLAVRNRDLGNLMAMARRAVLWGLTTHQDWEHVEREEEPRGRILWYTPADLKKILAACTGIYTTVTLLGARAGLRRGEMMHLEWEDISFREKRLHIVSKPDKGWAVKNYENRFVPLADDLLAHLKAIRRPSGWVLLGPGGKRYTDEVVSVYYRKILRSRRVRLSGSIHSLRHTFASHLVQANVPLLTVSKLLGHKSVKTTEIYAHLAPKSFDDAVAALPDLK